MKHSELEIAGMLQDNNDTINALTIEVIELKNHLSNARELIANLKEDLKLHEESEAMDRDAMEYTEENDAYLKKRYLEIMAEEEPEEHKEYRANLTIQDKIDSGEFKIIDYDPNDEQPH